MARLPVPGTFRHEPMVSYQRWTSLAFETAKAQGYDTSTAEKNAEAVSEFADVWNRRKAELSTATVSEAREIAEQEISVS